MYVLSLLFAKVNKCLDSMPSAFLKSYDESEAEKQEEEYKDAKAVCANERCCCL